MRPEQWAAFKKAAKREPDAGTPVAAIVDSPWIPGYLGISHLEYYFDTDVWLDANLRIMREFPDIIFLPSWWVEFGMAIEPSAFGDRVRFWPDRTPDQIATLRSATDVDRLAPVDAQTDGLMPAALQRYRSCKGRIFDAGYTIPMVAARGPLCVASFLRGVSEFMMDIVDEPDAVHKLLDLTTRCVIDWLSAQAEAIGDSVEGILVLDDIVGFLSLNAYREFAHPYLKRICDAFPSGWVKVYHNDANVRPFLSELPAAGFDVLNWSHKIPVKEAYEKTGGRVCLMGNVAPLEIGVRGTPEMVLEAASQVLDSGASSLILSVGGGVSPGMPAENLRALARAAAARAASQMA
ncbi:MAG: uroporphyrinogen decarboxylase family protein [bacterium]|jgi:uroporphyrinogen-III decarboxylase